MLVMWQITKCELINNNICMELTNNKTNKVFMHNINQTELKTCSTKQLFSLLTKIIQGIKTPGLEIKILNICEDRVALKIIFSTMEIQETINFGKTLDSYHIILKNEIIKLKNEIAKLKEEKFSLQSDNNYLRVFSKKETLDNLEKIKNNSKDPPECSQQ